MHVLNHNGTLLLCPHYSYHCIGLLSAQRWPQHSTCESSALQYGVGTVLIPPSEEVTGRAVMNLPRVTQLRLKLGSGPGCPLTGRIR